MTADEHRLLMAMAQALLLVTGFTVPPAVMNGRSEVANLMKAIEQMKARELYERPTNGT